MQIDPILLPLLGVAVATMAAWYLAERYAPGAAPRRPLAELIRPLLALDRVLPERLDQRLFEGLSRPIAASHMSLSSQWVAGRWTLPGGLGEPARPSAPVPPGQPAIPANAPDTQTPAERLARL